ncbi:hypothetical protein HanHA300_Chr07g0231981 [Helianthus annuus]|nr:hypothetical protein HanHA300_Chr07g0231981 [Helianthus annuus]KAJ0562253.1 hypothetical protein HanHA89_Chr07g0249141 [Helianthus annuus]
MTCCKMFLGFVPAKSFRKHPCNSRRNRQLLKESGIPPSSSRLCRSRTCRSSMDPNSSGISPFIELFPNLITVSLFKFEISTGISPFNLLYPMFITFNPLHCVTTLIGISPSKLLPATSKTSNLSLQV